ASVAVDTNPDFQSKATETTLENVTAGQDIDPNSGQQPEADVTGEWTTLATFLPNGTCKEDVGEVVVAIQEGANSTPIRVHIRGLTGAVWVTTGDGTNAVGSPTGGPP